jgi:exonuclease SbcC
LRLLAIQLTNFKSYQELSLDLDSAPNGSQRSVIAIVGENGAGKTSILEAVGATLFDYVEGKHGNLVRERERTAEVKVTVAVPDPASPGDERIYTVTRRFGANPIWQVEDVDAQVRITEKAEETRRWIAQQLGLDEAVGLDLASLFRDAVGVPQGTITAPFLERPQDRKEKFDRLLRLKEFEKSAENLRDVEREFQNRIETLKAELHRLSEEVAQLPDIKDQLLETLSTLNQHRTEITWLRKELEDTETRLTHLQDLERSLNAWQKELKQLDQQISGAEEKLSLAWRRLEEAIEASHIVSENTEAFRRYEKTQARLAEIRAHWDRWQKIDAERGKLEERLSGLERQIDDTKQQLAQRRELAQSIPVLEELSQQEEQIRHRLRLLEDNKGRLTSLRALIAEAETHIEKAEEQIRRARSERAEIEAGRQLAESYQFLRGQRDDTKNRLTLAYQSRNSLQELRAKSATLSRKLQEKYDHLHQAEKTAKGLPALKARIGEAEDADKQVRSLRDQRARLETLLHEAKLALEQSKGGNCPFLREPCRNMAEGQTLEGYFRSQTARVQAEIDRLDGEISRLQPLAEELAQLHRQVEAAQTASEQIEILRKEVEELQEELESCSRELETQAQNSARIPELEKKLETIEDELQRAQAARERLASLDQLDRLVQQLTQAKAHAEEQLQALRKEAKELEDALATKPELEHRLELLGIPGPSERLQAARQAQRDAEHLSEKLSRLESDRQDAFSRLKEVQDSLKRFPPDLAAQKDSLEKELQGLERAKELYLTYLKIAEDRPVREREVKETASKLHELEELRNTLKLKVQEAEAAVDPAQIQHLQTTRFQLNERLRDLTEETGRLEERQKTLEAQQKKLKEKEEQKLAKEQAVQDLEGILSFLGTLRKQIRSVGDEIGRHMVKAVARTATTMFHDIMGGIAGELEWSPEDYSLKLRIGSSERLFAQLSGGEQMAAALAIRLALLQNLSNIRFAFFDEPTQNLDQVRREALAEQIGNIQNIRGFDQIFVISHDDTFTARTDMVIRVVKRAGMSAATLE